MSSQRKGGRDQSKSLHTGRKKAWNTGIEGKSSGLFIFYARGGGGGIALELNGEEKRYTSFWTKRKMNYILGDLRRLSKRHFMGGGGGGGGGGGRKGLLKNKEGGK